MAGKKSLTPLIILNIALFALLIGIAYSVFRPIEGAPTADQIPAFGMQSAMHEDGFSDADLQGDLFLLNIFASWCTPCEAEHPVLTDLAQLHNIPLYGIAMKDEPDDLDNFLERLGNPYTDIGMDNAGLMMNGLGLQGVPTTFVVNNELNIIKTWQGPITPTIAQNEILPLFE